MHHTLTASLPQHIYGYVDMRILTGMNQDLAGKFEPCVILAVTSRPSRALHFEILCESGAKWANIPINMLRWEIPTAPEHPMNDLQCWDCHGWDFALFAIEYMREMGCEYKTPDGRMIPAHYLCTLDHTDNGFSLYPPEHKNLNILLLEDGSGQIAAMPNNRILWKDDSFVKRDDRRLKEYRVMSPQTWHAESGRHNPQDTAITRDA
jgi:hypothetical protein